MTFCQYAQFIVRNILGNLFEYVTTSPCHDVLFMPFLLTNADLAGKLLMFMLTSAKKKIYIYILCRRVFGCFVKNLA